MGLGFHGSFLLRQSKIKGRQNDPFFLRKSEIKGKQKNPFFT